MLLYQRAIEISNQKNAKYVGSYFWFLIHKSFELSKGSYINIDNFLQNSDFEENITEIDFFNMRIFFSFFNNTPQNVFFDTKKVQKKSILRALVWLNMPIFIGMISI